MGNLIASTGTAAIDIAKGTLKYFSGFLKETNTAPSMFVMPDLENNNEINNLFDSWEDVNYKLNLAYDQ